MLSFESEIPDTDDIDLPEITDESNDDLDEEIAEDDEVDDESDTTLTP